MKFRWADYVAFAEDVYQQASHVGPDGAHEAALRSCISRAYYGAFNVSLAELRRTGWNPPPGGEKHGWTIRRFSAYRSTDPAKQQTWNKIGEDLDRLRQYRNSADYDDRLDGTPTSRAKASLRYAATILTVLDRP